MQEENSFTPISTSLKSKKFEPEHSRPGSLPAKFGKNDDVKPILRDQQTVPLKDFDEKDSFELPANQPPLIKE